MTDGLRIRTATAQDIDFLVAAIVSAEKSGSQNLGLATLFGLSEAQVAPLIGAMLQEEVDGCELSISSFLIAEVQGRPAAAVAGWIEGAVDEMPSAILKSNLIGATYPPESLEVLRAKAGVLAGLRIDRQWHALQLEYVHVDPAHRGHGWAGRLIEAHLDKARASAPIPEKAQVQAFGNNGVAVGLYDRLGFRVARTFTSVHPAITDHLPWHEKLLLERPL